MTSNCQAGFWAEFFGHCWDNWWNLNGVWGLDSSNAAMLISPFWWLRGSYAGKCSCCMSSKLKCLRVMEHHVGNLLSNSSGIKSSLYFFYFFFFFYFFCNLSLSLRLFPKWKSWEKRTSLIRWHLTRDLNEMREQATQYLKKEHSRQKKQNVQSLWGGTFKK